MIVGKKVVCVDDAFSAAIRQLYTALPVKGQTYTVREVSLGREKIAVIANGKIVPNGASEAGVTVRVLLNELRNPTDPFNGHRSELGFSSERFRELEEEAEEHALAATAEAGATA